MLKSLNKCRNGSSKGQILAIVLCFLALVGVMVAALLNLTGNGMKIGNRYAERSRLYYAADAGIEDALWKSDHEGYSFEEGDYDTELEYSLPGTINGKSVTVNVTQVWPLSGLESDEYGTAIYDSLTITGGIVAAAEGKFKIQMTYDGSEGDLPVDKVAVWLPSGYEYVPGSSKWSDSIEEVDPVITNERSGKVLTWNFDPPIDFNDLPVAVPGGGFTPGTEYPAIRRLYFQVTPVDETVRGSLPWIRTINTDLYLAWESGAALYHIISTAADNVTGQNYSLECGTYLSQGAGFGEGGFQVRGNYAAIGNSLMEDNIIVYDRWGNRDYFRDTLLTSCNATLPALPADAQIVRAYLYWSAWWDIEDADKEVFLQIDGGNCTDITASKWSTLPAAGHYSYSSFSDVTDLVSAIDSGIDHTFTVGNVSGLTGDHWSYAGWSMVVFYSSIEEDARQFFVYDQFLFAAGFDHHYFDIEGFEAPDDAEVSLTCFVGEGDDWRTGDYLQFNGAYLYGGVNPKYNVWNGLSSGLGGESIEGVDIDTFDASDYLEPHATTAGIHLYAGQDSWDLIYIILAFKSEFGGLSPNAIGIISYSSN